MLLPGVAETLAALRERGVSLGIASNCGQDYLDAMLNGLGLSRWIHEARCLDSPGASSKASMVGDLMETFGTRAAVMVGDRLGDRNAAWENGIPHVHLARGSPSRARRALRGDDRGDERARAAAQRRGAWIRGALEISVLGAPAGDGVATPATLGITGHAGAGRASSRGTARRVLASEGKRGSVVRSTSSKSGITSADPRRPRSGPSTSRSSTSSARTSSTSSSSA